MHVYSSLFSYFYDVPMFACFEKVLKIQKGTKYIPLAQALVHWRLEGMEDSLCSYEL